MDRRQFLWTTAGVGLGLGAGTSAFAQGTYPSKPVTLLCPFAAGGGGDILTRAAADHVRTKRNVAASVEYRPGAGATIAPGQIARAQPDGATIGLYSISPFLTVPHLQRVPYDTTKDFTYLAAYAYIPIAFYVTTESKFTTWESVVKFARDNPEKFRWGTSGVRGAAHVATEAAFRKEGAKTTFVPFTGGAEAITAMLGGHIEAVISADYGPQLAAGKVRLLAFTGSEKVAAFSSLPTFKDLKYPLSTEAIYGLFGPANLPSEIVVWWESAVREMMKTSEFDNVLKTASGFPVYLDSKQFTANVLENYKTLGRSYPDDNQVVRVFGRSILALIAAIALIAAVRYGLWQDRGPGPGLMPAVGAGLMIGALLLSLRSKQSLDVSDAHPDSRKSAVILVSGLVLVVPLAAAVGLLVALGVLALLLLSAVDKMPLARSLTISSCLAVGSWLIFERLLSVPLPKPMFW